MSTTEVLAGRDLDREIAAALGWKWMYLDHDGSPERRPYGPDTTLIPPDDQADFERSGWAYGRNGTDHWPDSIPSYHSSLDVLVAGPEARLREVGLVMVVDFRGSSMTPFLAAWRVDETPEKYVGYSDDSEAEARARACLAALRVLESQRP